MGGGWRCSTGDVEIKARFCFNRKPCLFGDCDRYVKKVLETGSFLHRVPIGEPGVGLVLPGNLADRLRRAVETESFPLWELRGEPGRRASLLGTLKDI